MSKTDNIYERRSSLSALSAPSLVGDEKRTIEGLRPAHLRSPPWVHVSIHPTNRPPRGDVRHWDGHTYKPI
ncbi:hypothetical protein [Porphyromonas sp.]